MTPSQRYALTFRHRGKQIGLEVEDLVQEAELALFRSRNKFDPERGSYSTWRYMVIRKHLLNVVDRGDEMREAQAGGGVDTLSAGILRLDTMNVLSRAELSNTEKNFVEKFLTGLSVSDISKEWGVSQQYVDCVYRSVISKCKDVLKLN